MTVSSSESSDSRSVYLCDSGVPVCSGTPFLFIVKVQVVKTSSSFLLFALFLAGCSGGDGRVTVTGTVTWNGEPLESGLITMVTRGQSSDAAPIIKGSFEIQTLPGEKNVGITSRRVLSAVVDAERGTASEVSYQFIPSKFNEQTELMSTITSGDTPLTFDLVGEEIPPPKGEIDQENRPPAAERSR